MLQLHQDQLRHLLNKDMSAWVDTFAEDAVFELPFAPGGYPQRLVGKAAIREYVKDYAKHIDLYHFHDVVVHAGHDPNTLVVEAVVEGRVLATGGPYRVRYVWVYTEENGKIVRQRDYWNPRAVGEALGGEAAMRDTFNVTS
ncbi:nuclear transport factor 2 family protein [Mycolicibacterium sp. P9-64]|nr:nuclear transport factor 2 family protein [Mycolicibacterium sp. P9-64]